MRSFRFVFALLVALVFLTTRMPGAVVPAQAQGDGPLILVAVPGDLGARLASRLQARLNSTLRGHEVLARGAPIYTEAFARRLGQQYGASLVAWASLDEPDVIYNIPTTIGPFAQVQPDSIALPLDETDQRLITAYVRATVGQAVAIVGECDRALLALDGALLGAPEGWPGLAEVYYYRGTCHTQQGNLEAALDDFIAATDTGAAWHYPAALGWTHFNMGEVRLAIQAYDAAIALAPENANLYLDRAFFHEERFDHEAAIADYTTAIRLQPDNPIAYQRRAEAYFNVADFASALADYNTLVALLPDDPYVLAGRAEVFLAMQDYQATLDDLEAALALEPEQPDSIIFLRGLTYLYQEEFDVAIADLQNYTALRPEDPAGWMNLAQAHEGLDHWLAAAEASENALALDPAATWLYGDLARFYYEASQTFPPDSLEAADYLDRCLASANTAIEDYGQDSEAYLYRAMAYMIQGRNENALEDLNTALSIDPGLEDAFFRRAIVYTRLGDIAHDPDESERLYWAAIDDYTTLMALDVDTYSYLRPYRGYLYVNVGAFEDALDDLASYAETSPESLNQTSYYYLAQTYAGLERLDEALETYVAALEGNSAWYSCQARLAVGVLLGNEFGDTVSGAYHLEQYVDHPCTSNPILLAIVHSYMAAWE